MNINIKEENRLTTDFFNFPLPVQRILYEAEQPVVYITATKQGQEMLAFVASETTQYQYIIVAPVTHNLIEDLECGHIGILEAITNQWMWMVRCDFKNRNSDTWIVTKDEIPIINLPKPNTYLLSKQYS